MMKRADFDPNYFRFPKPFLAGFVAWLLVLLFFTVYWPESVMLDYYGPLGRLGRFMHSSHPQLLLSIYIIAIGLHVGEAMFAWYLCSKRGISYLATFMWVLQTFVIGFPSLMRLVPYKPLVDRKGN